MLVRNRHVAFRVALLICLYKVKQKHEEFQKGF